MSIRAMDAADWPAVAEIYRQGMLTGKATFESEVPTFEAWDAAHRKNCRMVAVVDGAVSGWAALSQVSSRSVYRGVAEVSVYVADGSRRRGVGEAMLRALIEASEKDGVWTLQSGIFTGNAASIALHQKCGFRAVGRRDKLGRDKGGQWRDILLMERRSDRVGV
jgi:phosphinothricin acetyltransferase